MSWEENDSRDARIVQKEKKFLQMAQKNVISQESHEKYANFRDRCNLVWVSLFRVDEKIDR